MGRKERKEVIWGNGGVGGWIDGKSKNKISSKNFSTFFRGRGGGAVREWEGVRIEAEALGGGLVCNSPQKKEARSIRHRPGALLRVRREVITA